VCAQGSLEDKKSVGVIGKQRVRFRSKGKGAKKHRLTRGSSRGRGRIIKKVAVLRSEWADK